MSYPFPTDQACRRAGAHLLSCDDDAYCNSCGHQYDPELDDQQVGPLALLVGVPAAMIGALADRIRRARTPAMHQPPAGRYGVSWYGEHSSIAQTAYRFRRRQAARVAVAGSTAPDFWAWARQQPFTIDELTDGSDLPVVRADAELPDQSSLEFTAWSA